MRASIWLAWRELVTRKSGLAWGIAMVGVVVALCSATDLISRAREVAVATQIDHIGPALRLIPAGRSASDLARFDLGAGSFTADEVRRLKAELSPWIRALDGRLLVMLRLEGGTVPTIGVDPEHVISSFDALGRLATHDAVLGKVLAERRQNKTGDELRASDGPVRVTAVLPDTASADDLALYLPLARLRDLIKSDGAVNEIRVFPAPGARMDDIGAYLASKHPEFNVINVYRGDAAEHEIPGNLYQHRHVLYMIMAAVIALCIFIWSYLNAGERRLEMATVVAIGGTRLIVLLLFVLRAAIIAFIGAVAGYIIGASVALSQDFKSGSAVILSWMLLLSITGGVVLLSIAGAALAAVFSAFRDQVAVLQEE